MGVDLLYKEESYQIIGACFEVYKDKGSGFLEAVYQECLAIEFADRGVSSRASRSDVSCFSRVS